MADPSVAAVCAAVVALVGRAIPASMSLTFSRPFSPLVTRMLLAVRSRWITPWLCANDSPLSTWIAMSTARAGSMGPGSWRSRKANVAPETSSVTTQ